MFAKLNFLLILLLANKRQHLIIFLISIFLIFLLASTLFISSSIQYAINTSLQDQADFTITRYKAATPRETPLEWADEFLEIEGVSSVVPRIYGTYYYESKEQHFMVVGINFFEKQVSKSIAQLVDTIEIDKFLEKKYMIIGAGVKEFFDTYAYTDYYIFRPPDRSKEKVYIYKDFINESAIVTNDMILMPSEVAKKVLGLKESEVTDILIYVTNKAELQTIYTKLIISHFDMQIVTKEDILKYYKNLFNYKGGLFLVLYIITFILFLLIIYQRYSMIKNSDIKEIAILRSLGWKIGEIINFKLFESALVIITAYLVGVILAFIYIFYSNAPLLKQIFLGYSNLSLKAIEFTPHIDYADLTLLFLLFVIPFLLAIVTPLWRLSTVEPSEVLR